MVYQQNNLKIDDRVNLGRYYTQPNIVKLAYSLFKQHIGNLNNYIFMDTACGYGNFLPNSKAIGADSDSTALNQAKANKQGNKYFNHNSLTNVTRKHYALKVSDKIIVVGNPPYNDSSSQVRGKIKQQTKNKAITIDSDLASHDLGISFLLSYNKLKACYVCVLHPLSYLIKKSNFNSLKAFKDNYRLLNSIIISSNAFQSTSKNSPFPIIIALYKRDSKGMNYNDILNYNFTTLDNRQFCLAKFDNLSNYATKYPNKKENNYVSNFYTLRDINALKRSKTFINNEIANSIRVTPSKLAFYCYADIFKDNISHIPYYFGNNDIMIDYAAFIKLRSVFMQKSLAKYPFLAHLRDNVTATIDNDEANKLIENYFKNLLGVHYA
jgi:hypothetical protein